MSVFHRAAARFGLWTVLVSLAISTSAAGSISGKDRWLRVLCEGELVLSRSAEQFREVMRAAQDSADLVLVEIESQSSRPDVILSMVREIRASRVPVYVYARNFPLACGGVLEPGSLPRARSRPTVDTGSLLLGLAARGFAADGEVCFRQEIDPNLLELAPEKTSWDEVYEELVEGATADLVRRGAADGPAREFAMAIVTPREPRWLAINSATGAFSVLGPDASSLDGAPAGSALVSTNSVTGRPFALIQPGDACSIGLCELDARGADTWMARLGMRSDRVESRSLGLHALHWKLRVVKAGRQLKDVDEGLDALSELLKLPDPAKRSVAKDTYRKAGVRGLEKVAQTQEQIEALEQDLRDYPELLRTAPPGQTEVGAKPSSFASKWRSMVQARKDKLAKLKAKAEMFAAE